MPKVEFYEKSEDKLLFEGNFEFLPRIGETIAKEMGDYFNYYNVVEIWHREDGQTGVFQACAHVEIDD